MTKMTKAESRKMARLEEENAMLKEHLARSRTMELQTIREAIAYRIAAREIDESISAARAYLSGEM